MKAVFVSYSRTDADSVMLLVEHLRHAGFNVWHDERLRGGQHWWDSILNEIRDCDVLVFVLSHASLQSDACKRECSYAMSLAKMLIPVLLSGDLSLRTLPRPYSERNVIDFRDDRVSATLKLIGAINTSPGAPPLPSPLPAPPSTPLTYLSGLNERVMTPETLGANEQVALCDKLEVAQDKGHTPAEIRACAAHLLARTDLVPIAKARASRLLTSLEPKIAHPGHERDVSTVPSDKATDAAQKVIAIVSRYSPRIKIPGVFYGDSLTADRRAMAVLVKQCPEAPEDLLMVFDGSRDETLDNGWILTPVAFYDLRPATRSKTWLFSTPHANETPANDSLLLSDLRTVVMKKEKAHCSLYLNGILAGTLPRSSSEGLSLLGLMFREIRTAVGGRPNDPRDAQDAGWTPRQGPLANDERTLMERRVLEAERAAFEANEHARMALQAAAARDADTWRRDQERECELIALENERRREYASHESREKRSLIDEAERLVDIGEKAQVRDRFDEALAAYEAVVSLGSRLLDGGYGTGILDGLLTRVCLLVEPLALVRGPAAAVTMLRTFAKTARLLENACGDDAHSLDTCATFWESTAATAAACGNTGAAAMASERASALRERIAKLP